MMTTVTQVNPYCEFTLETLRFWQFNAANGLPWHSHMIYMPYQRTYIVDLYQRIYDIRNTYTYVHKHFHQYHNVFSQIDWRKVKIHMYVDHI